MPARFTFEIDRPRNLVRIVMTGLFEPADAAHLFEERRKAYALLDCGPHQHVVLADVRAMKIQPQQTVAAFQALMADRESRARRLAFVVAPTLVRSQLMRTLVGGDCRCFSDPVEAEAWLLEGEPEAVDPEARAKAEPEPRAEPKREVRQRWAA